MKKLILILCIFFSLQSHSQCRKTFVYGFELIGTAHPELVTATVFYKGKAIIPQKEIICGKPLKIKTTFTYLKHQGKILDGIKLPYQFPANCFYWLMTDDMAIEMVMHPDRFKIVLDTKDRNLKLEYELPITYDFISQNAIYLDLIDKSEANIQKEFSDKIYGFAIYKKEHKPQVKDTILIYSSRQKIPDGILLRFPELQNMASIHSVQEFEIPGMLFNRKIFLKMPESKAPKFDAQTGLYISLDGKKCATSGGITGNGFGECAGANVSKDNKPIPYQINIQIEP